MSLRQCHKTCHVFADPLSRLQRGDTGDKNANAKKKWFEEKQKRKHAELERLGLDTTEMHRIETAEQVCACNGTACLLVLHMSTAACVSCTLW